MGITMRMQELKRELISERGAVCEGSDAFPECRKTATENIGGRGQKLEFHVYFLNGNSSNEDEHNIKLLCSECAFAMRGRFIKWKTYPPPPPVFEANDGEIHCYGGYGWATWMKFKYGDRVVHHFCQPSETTKKIMGLINNAQSNRTPNPDSDSAIS